jgi:hypothetical protein
MFSEGQLFYVFSQDDKEEKAKVLRFVQKNPQLAEACVHLAKGDLLNKDENEQLHEIRSAYLETSHRAWQALGLAVLQLAADGEIHFPPKVVGSTH